MAAVGPQKKGAAIICVCRDDLTVLVGRISGSFIGNTFMAIDFRQNGLAPLALETLTANLNNPNGPYRRLINRFGLNLPDLNLPLSTAAEAAAEAAGHTHHDTQQLMLAAREAGATEETINASRTSNRARIAVIQALRNDLLNHLGEVGRELIHINEINNTSNNIKFRYAYDDYIGLQCPQGNRNNRIPNENLTDRSTRTEVLNAMKATARREFHEECGFDFPDLDRFTFIGNSYDYSVFSLCINTGERDQIINGFNAQTIPGSEISRFRFGSEMLKIGFVPIEQLIRRGPVINAGHGAVNNAFLGWFDHALFRIELPAAPAAPAAYTNQAGLICQLIPRTNRDDFNNLLRDIILQNRCFPPGTPLNALYQNILDNIINNPDFNQAWNNAHALGRTAAAAPAPPVAAPATATGGPGGAAAGPLPLTNAESAEVRTFLDPRRGGGGGGFNTGRMINLLQRFIPTATGEVRDQAVMALNRLRGNGSAAPATGGHGAATGGPGGPSIGEYRSIYRDSNSRSGSYGGPGGRNSGFARSGRFDRTNYIHSGDPYNRRERSRSRSRNRRPITNNRGHATRRNARGHATRRNTRFNNNNNGRAAPAPAPAPVYPHLATHRIPENCSEPRYEHISFRPGTDQYGDYVHVYSKYPQSTIDAYPYIQYYLDQDLRSLAEYIEGCRRMGGRGGKRTMKKRNRSNKRKTNRR